MSRPMTDREMLLMAYGALKACEPENENLSYVIDLITDHLYPNIENRMDQLPEGNKNVTT